MSIAGFLRIWFGDLQGRSPLPASQRIPHHSLRRTHVTYSRLANVDAEFQQLTVDLGRTPERVLATHSPNELAYFLRHGWPSTLTMATLPCPEQTKSLPLPANDRICLDNHQSPFAIPATGGTAKPKANDLWRSIAVVSRNAATRSVDAEVPGFQSEGRCGYETSQPGR